MQLCNFLDFIVFLLLRLVIEGDIILIIIIISAWFSSSNQSKFHIVSIEAFCKLVIPFKINIKILKNVILFEEYVSL